MKLASLLHPLKVSSILLFTLILSACGFQFRGDYLINPQLQTLYVSSDDTYGELTRITKRYFSQNRIHLADQKTDDMAELRILKDKLNRRTLSVFNNGQVAEYELIYTVNYQLTLTDGSIKNIKFELNRDYQDDPDQALAKSRELALLLSEMRTQAADNALRWLASIQP